MTGSGDTVLGSNWFENYVLCRKTPKSFMDSRKLSKEAFCLDIIKDLCSDLVDPQCKVHLLLLLQEHVNFLIHNADLLEQTVGSLKNLYGTSDNKLLNSQMLITITTILLTCENLNVPFSSLVSETKTMLVNILLVTPNDHIIVSTACRCLEEIEIFYPQILLSDVERLWSLCQSHLLPSFQDYVILIGLCLKHTTEARQKSENESFTDSSSLDKEPPSPLGSDVQILPIVAYLLDILPLMTQAAVYNVFKNLIIVVKNTPELLPAIKPWIPRLIVSSDVLHFHLAFDLLKEFGRELFTSQEEETLLRQLVIVCNHPSLTTSHRLLYMDWLSSCINNKDIFSCSFPTSNVALLLPKPFDGPFTQEKKLGLLTLCMIPNKKSGKSSRLFMNSLNGLKQSALLPSGTKAATSLFRSLFLYCSFNKNSSIISDIHRMVALMVMLSPYLTPYALNFLHIIKNDCGTSSYFEDSLGKLVEHVVNLPIKLLTNHIYDYLLVMEAAASEKHEICKPKALLRCLQKLVSQSSSIENDQWLFGNSILAVCRLFFKFHNTQVLFYDISELLHLIMKHIPDVDIRLRAKMYYAAFTSLSKSKMDALFQAQSCSKTAACTLTSFATGMEPSFNFCNTLQQLSKPVLQLVRVQKTYDILLSETLVSPYDQSQAHRNILKIYNDSIHSELFESSVKIPFIMKHVEDCDKKFSRLYAVVVTMDTSPSSKKTSEIEVPVLSLNSDGANEGVPVVAEFVPCGPYPVNLIFRAEFTCSSGSSYISELPVVKLKFEDLFNLIPFPCTIISSETAWKSQLFEEMWNFLRCEAHKGVEVSRCCSSGLRLQVNTNDLKHFVLTNLEPFIISKPPETSDFCIAIFLPPSCHLLMRFILLNDCPFVHILTDDWAILPFVNTYLRKLN